MYLHYFWKSFWQRKKRKKQTNKQNTHWKESGSISKQIQTFDTLIVTIATIYHYTPDIQ
jgi:hypothetical protein